MVSDTESIKTTDQHIPDPSEVVVALLDDDDEEDVVGGIYTKAISVESFCIRVLSIPSVILQVGDT